MKRRIEFLITKRDGRREWLRASKLVRSIGAALRAVEGPPADEAAFELASVVIRAMRKRSDLVEPVWPPEDLTCLCSTDELSAAVERALFVSGHPQAAVRYAAVRDERRRRTQVATALRDERMAPTASAVPASRTSSRVGPVGLRSRITFDQN